jgi:adenosylhomocysteine nucleosidase
MIFDSCLLQKYSISKPLVNTRLIASGNEFISDPRNNFDLCFSHKENETLAAEMEGASVAQICEEHNIPYIIIRVISDKAALSAVIDFQSFISDIANKYSSEIVKEYLAINTGDAP